MKKVCLALLLAVFLVPCLLAGSYTFNDRPITTLPAAPYPGEPSLQQILNISLTGNAATMGPIDAVTDQNSAAMWHTSDFAYDFKTRLMVEFTANAPNAEFGMWGLDGSKVATLPILLGPATGNYGTPVGNTTADVEFNPGAGTVTIWGKPGDAGVAAVTDKATPITPNAFGFYLKVGSSYFFSADVLNNGTPRMMAYNYKPPTGTDAWYLAFEDGSDMDFQDVVVKVTEISAVPEPAGVLLLGTVLFGIGLALRRRLA